MLPVSTGVNKRENDDPSISVIEASVAMSFLSDVYARYFGVLGAVHLLVAGAAVYRVNKGKWLWNFGGYEYCVFWAACCLAVAIDT